jgi:hypothetical protein
MAFQKTLQLNWHPSMNTSAPSAIRLSKSMEASGFVRGVALSHLNPELRVELREAGRVRLTTLTRSSILVVGTSEDITNSTLVAAADSVIRPCVAALGSYHLRLGGWVQLSNLDFHRYFVLFPNSRQCPCTEELLSLVPGVTPGCAKALHGLVDRCVYPNCVGCRQSALCVTDGMVFSVSGELRVRDPQGASGATVGARLEQHQVTCRDFRAHSRPFVQKTLDGSGVDIWAVLSYKRSKFVRIEYARAT